MHTLEEAQARALALVAPLATEASALERGRILRAPLVARADVPAAPTSMMDGYALRSGDALRLRVVEESAAGAPSARPLEAGEAAPISTGALLPAGADAVVPIERTRREGERVVIDRAARPGELVRGRGSDLRAGELILPAGTALTPAAIALACGEGRATLEVARRPRVQIFSMGRELRPLGEPLPPGSLYDANGPALRAACHEAGAEAALGALLGDDREAIAAALRDADGDLLLTSGGASVGPHDHLRAAIEAAGGEVVLWRVAMKPGKPLVLGRIGERPVVGLPGNPVSALVSFLLFVRPMLRRMLGATDLHLPRMRARLGGALPGGGDRRELVRARLELVGGEAIVHPAARQGSAALIGLAHAGALIDVGAGDPPRGAGELVEVWSLPS